MIPKIIHQTWKAKNLPEEFKSFAASWKQHHPTWQYRLWDDEDNFNLIKDVFPWFLPIYKNYSLPIQRVDAARYFILYHYGGVYVDLDFYCYRPIDPLLENADCLFGTEAMGHCIDHQVERIISNAFMAATPKQPFFYAILMDLLTHVPDRKDAAQMVLETTGPLMLNRVYERYSHKQSITLLPSSYLFPLTYTEAQALRTGNASTDILSKLTSAYGVHHHVGTWWKDGMQLQPAEKG